MIFIKFGGFRPLFIQIFLLSLFESPIGHMLIHSLLSHKFQSERRGKFLHFVTDCLRPQGLYSPWNSPGQNTGVGSHSLLQGIFPTQGSNSGLPRCRRILYQLNHQESPTSLKVLFIFFFFSFCSSDWQISNIYISSYLLLPVFSVPED